MKFTKSLQEYFQGENLWQVMKLNQEPENQTDVRVRSIFC